MKKLLLCCLILASSYGVIAQSTATTGSVEFQKGSKQSALIELPYNSDVVSKAIKDYFLKKGIKEEKSKGFQVYRGARLSPADGELADLYFKVDRKSRKENNASTVYLIVGRPNENVALRTPGDAYKVEEGKTLLNEMVPSIDAYSLEVDIATQAEVVNKAEKRLKNLEEEQADLEKKIRNYQEKLAQNKRDQEAQNAEVLKQRAARDAMQGRRAAPTATP